jgi:hypothetical protein
MTDAFFAQNRLNWDDRADIHIRDEAGGYRIDAFLQGEDNLHDIEHDLGRQRPDRTFSDSPRDLV